MERIKSRLISDNNKIWQNSQIPEVIALRENMESGLVRILGPCALQSLEQLLAIVDSIGNQADIIRAPGFKPRTNPFNPDGSKKFTGLGAQASREIYQKTAKQKPGIRIASEVMSEEQLKQVAKQLFLIWIGARTQNPELLEKLGRYAVWTQTIIMIKNGLLPDIESSIVAKLNSVANGIEQASKKLGKPPVPMILCLRGTYTKDPNYRNKPNWQEVKRLKESFPELPIIIDPSHILPKKKITPEGIGSLLQEAFGKAIKPDGYMIEVHHRDYPSLTDPGVEVLALLQLLATINLGK